MDVWLVPSAERAVSALTERLGDPVGVEGVLDDLNRRARNVRPPASATWGFEWDPEDARSHRWWPQGISSSADRSIGERLLRRSVLVTSAYSRDLHGVNHGARLTFVDLETLRYRPVLLVEPYVADGGRVDVRPVKIHAGGIVWHGPWLHVAATERGLCTFRLEDITRVPGEVQEYRYVLPLRFTYDAGSAPDVEPFRYSFLSLDRGESPARLVAGEYGRGEMSTRLAVFEMDPDTTLPLADADGLVAPLLVYDGGVPRMHGATVVDGLWFVTSGAGRRRGSVWTGQPYALHRHARVLPAGPEDITYWPSTDQLWCLTDRPGHRYVLTLPRKQFSGLGG